MGDGQTGLEGVLNDVAYLVSIPYKIFNEIRKLENEVKTVMDGHKYNKRLEHLVGSNGHLLEEFKEKLAKYTLIGETKDKESRYHPIIVGELCGIIAEKLGMSAGYVRTIKRMGFIHDIGKCLVKRKVLNKPGKLTKSESKEIYKHVSPYGIELAKKLAGEISSKDLKREVIKVGIKVIEQHHENYDGSGLYGLKGSDITMHGIIIRGADVYSAIRSKRPYKDEYTHKETLDVMLYSGDEVFKPLFLHPHIRNVFAKHEASIERTFDSFQRLLS